MFKVGDRVRFIECDEEELREYMGDDEIEQEHSYFGIIGRIIEPEKDNLFKVEFMYKGEINTYFMAPMEMELAPRKNHLPEWL